MISNVCQSLQSHVLSFQLFPQEPSYYSSRSSPEVGENSKESVEAVSNGNEEVYIHPLVKKSCTRLSKESLEICTESLGSESGSDMGENDISLMTMEADDCGSPSVRCSTWKHEKGNRKRSYPPPLTSMGGVRMESYREDGRLVLRAVACSNSCSSHFHAERSQGRLKLQLVKVKDMAKQKENAEQVEGQEQQQQDEAQENEEIIENFERARNCCSSTSTSSSTCKQEGKELLNWNPRWVST